MASEEKTTASGDRRVEEAADALDRLLVVARVPVREGFAREVMERLPETPWRRRRKREWAMVASMGAFLAAVAAYLFASGEAPRVGFLAALVELAVATLGAGAGFLAASWRSLGQAVDAALEGSVATLVGLGIAVLAAYALLFLLLRRRRPAARRPPGHEG